LQLQSLELCQATRNRRQRAPANGRHTIEFNAAGCPANANLRQNLQAKAKVKRTQSSTKLRVAHLFVKRSSAFMLAAPAWHHAHAAQHHTLLLAWQQWQVISGTTVHLFNRRHRK